MSWTKSLVERESLLRTSTLLASRRRQLIEELDSIYPIVTLGSHLFCANARILDQIKRLQQGQEMGLAAARPV